MSGCFFCRRFKLRLSALFHAKRHAPEILFNSWYCILLGLSRNMKHSNTIRSGRHCVFNMHVHLVFVTKYRRTVFTKAILSQMKMIFQLVCEQFEMVEASHNQQTTAIELTKLVIASNGSEKLSTKEVFAIFMQASQVANESTALKALWERFN